MQTKETPVPIWTEPYWRAIPIRSLKGWHCATLWVPSKGIVYVRSEYPLAVKMVSNAITQARGTGAFG